MVIIELEDSSGSIHAHEIVIEGGKVLGEDSLSFFLIDSLPYSPTTFHSFLLIFSTLDLLALSIFDLLI